MRSLFRYLRCRSGATAIEYTILVGGLALAVATAVFLLGDDLLIAFEALDDTAVSAQDNIESNQ